MYDVIMAYTATTQASGCASPAIFEMVNGSYDPFAAYATSSGNGAEWVSWSADEECLQAGASNDVPIELTATPWCQLTANQH
jgi:hypothetical protein